MLVEFLPIIEIDQAGKERGIWMLYGSFPLDEIVAGKRACRAGWRNRGFFPPWFFSGENDPDDTFDLLAVEKCEDQDGDYLLFTRESAEFFVEGSKPFSSIEDLQAKDWYVEIGSMPEEEALDFIPVKPSFSLR